MRITKLSTALLRRLVMLYVLFAAMVVGFSVVVQYRNTYKEVRSTLQSLLETFAPVTEAAIWEFQTELLRAVTVGLAQHSEVVSVEITEKGGGLSTAWHAPSGETASPDLTVTHIIYRKDAADKTELARLQISSSDTVVYNLLKKSIGTLILVASLQFAFLGLALWLLARRLLVSPLTDFSDQVKSLAYKQQGAEIQLRTNQIAEIDTLRHGFNHLMRELADSHAEVAQQNEDLELRVKERTREAELARELAETANRTKSSFLANMSHEIRTPMNAILGLLDLLQRTELNGRQRDYASKTEGAARSLLGLLNDILDFSKVEAGKMTLESEPFRIDSLLRSLSTILSTNAGTKDIEVLFDIDSSLPAVVRGDAMRLQQVLINLGANAVKFTSKGHVLISMHKLSDVAGTVTIQFSVQDTGIGIAPENQLHIFDGFSQAEGSTTRRFGGTGLGLVISKRFIELMGGDVKLTSEPGVGSTFSFTIDMPKGDTVADVRIEPSPSTITPQRILVIDDNPIAGELTLRMVRSWGWTADLANSGKQALEMIGSRIAYRDTDFPYPVIFMDWKMPDMDGWEVTGRIRQLVLSGNFPQPLVMMLTAHGRETLAMRTEAEQEMIDGFLAKPVTASMLYDALMEAAAGNVSVRKIAKGRSSTRQLSGVRILVVEDNLINQQVADELLTAQGAIVSLAANGQLGVEAVAAAAPQFDVVLMDVQMPVLDGYGATRIIREELGLTDLPIVAMTANAMLSDRDACLDAGMNEHIGKPFDIGVLVSLLIRMTGLQPAPTTMGEPLGATVAVKNGIEIAGLDLQTALNRMSGMQTLYVRTARDFVRTLDTVVTELEHYLAIGDRQKALMRLHTVKGNAGTLGATALAEKAAQLEKLCATDAGMHECAQGLGPLETLVRSTQKTLHEAIVALESQSPNNQPATANTSGQLVSAAATNALRRIAELAQASDLEALQEFAHSRDSLSALPEDAVDALDCALQELDLMKVATLCNKMLMSLGQQQ